MFRDGVRPVSFRSVCGLVGSSDVVGVFVDEGVARGSIVTGKEIGRAHV